MTRPAPPAVFAWITGERTNIGDSLLRRPYLASLRQLGPVQLWINRSDQGFLSGLGLDGSEQLVPGFARWYGRLLASTLRRRTIVVVNAGELRVHASRVVLLTALLFASLLARIRGGAGVWIGASVPPSGRRVLSMPVRVAARLIDYVQWREPGSTWIADRAVGPDWAFAEGSPVPTWSLDARPLCAFVLRGDRAEPSPDWIGWARQLCLDHGLSAVVVVQVRQDGERARSLARQLDAEVIDWEPSASHREQEERVRGVYRESLLVVGDRLHGLILGATEGALPLGWVESSVGKTDRHFRGVGLPFVGAHESRPGRDLPRLSPDDLAPLFEELRSGVGDARDSLAAVHRDLGELRHDPRPRSLARQRRATRSSASRKARE